MIQSYEKLETYQRKKKIFLNKNGVSDGVEAEDHLREVY